MSLFRRAPRGSDPTPPAATTPENAWKALTVVIDWIKHADAKAGATIAAAGVLGTVLYGLIKDQRSLPVALIVSASACALFVVLGGVFAAWSLRPRLRIQQRPLSNLYFSHVAGHYPLDEGSERYEEAFRSLVGDGDRLVRELAWQVWVTSHIVRQKYRWGGYGLMCVLASLPFLAATAGIVLMGKLNP